ncbi:MAG: hypothetical protein NW217_03910 [Hyphomicrobiaceae bacterium]|nr:hypothetical protein [Hyphomicrobiaceae bacterium]
MNTIFAALVVATATAVIATDANAYSLQLVRSCSGDYYNYCSQHSPTSPGVKSCFRANGLKLSKGCVTALKAEGLVSEAEVARRQAAK